MSVIFGKWFSRLYDRLRFFRERFFFLRPAASVGGHGKSGEAKHHRQNTVSIWIFVFFMFRFLHFSPQQSGGVRFHGLDQRGKLGDIQAVAMHQFQDVIVLKLRDLPLDLLVAACKLRDFGFILIEIGPESF